MIRTVVTGVSGRMGDSIARLIRQADDLTLVGATERPGSEFLEREIEGGQGIAPVKVEEDLSAVLSRGADVVIDFTSPESSVKNAAICANCGVALVVGTTGLQTSDIQALEKAAAVVPVVFSPNMSMGVNLMFALAAEAAKALGESYNPEIMEIHHKHKKDSPSGTALRLAEVVAKALGRDPANDLRLARSGIVGERPAQEIGVQALRGGDVVGEHTVYFIGQGERLEITHRATNRDQFAQGALRAARFIKGKKPGLYDMSTVMGLNKS